MWESVELREIRATADRREGDAHHRDVEPVEEQHPAQDDQGAPQAGVPWTTPRASAGSEGARWSQ